MVHGVFIISACHLNSFFFFKFCTQMHLYTVLMHINRVENVPSIALKYPYLSSFCHIYATNSS